MTKMKNIEHKWTVQDIPSQAGKLVFAATSPNARKGGYYGPDGWMEAKGNPAAAFEPVVTKNETVGRRLWDESERVTDMQFVVSVPSIGIRDRHCVGDARQPVSRAE